jgi:hypothetical protein
VLAESDLVIMQVAVSRPNSASIHAGGRLRPSIYAAARRLDRNRQSATVQIGFATFPILGHFDPADRDILPRHLILSKWAHIPNWDWFSTATMPLVGILGSASRVRRFGVSI